MMWLEIAGAIVFAIVLAIGALHVTKFLLSKTEQDGNGDSDE